MEKPAQFPSMGEEKEQWIISTQKGAQDEQLELRLGPPGDRQWPTRDANDEKRCNRERQRDQKQQPRTSYLQSCEMEEFKCPEKDSPSCAAIGTNAYNKRVAPALVVGWPPIRSSRKKLTATGTSKQAPNTQNGGAGKEEQWCEKDLFVKINMEGVPIGRKINLNAYDSYEKLSVAIKELFSGLVSASRENVAFGNEGQLKIEAKGNEGDQTRNEEYTLVYEDNEGDRILVGDVPWHMFITTAKRLRVLKSNKSSLPRASR